MFRPLHVATGVLLTLLIFFVLFVGHNSRLMGDISDHVSTLKDAVTSNLQNAYTAAVGTNFVITPVRENSGEYQFINPLIFSKIDKSVFEEEFKPFHAQLTTYIQNATSTNAARDVSIYFRDLNSFHWTGVNEDEKYAPASMLKVLVLMATLKESISNPRILQKKLYFSGANDSIQYYKPEDNMTPGFYTVKNLYEDMIVHSDNGAATTLLSEPAIKSSFDKIYKIFLFPGPTAATEDDYMSARSYSVAFRSLYDSSYLAWDASESALKLLSGTTFDKGIVAGVPSDIKVAHKFGEYSRVNQEGITAVHELHDCGIVYYPEHPYLLCIMTRGQDFASLESVLAGASKLVYTYVNTKATEAHN